MGHCEESHGFHICVAHPGVDVSDIIELESIHGWGNGVCQDATGNKKDIGDLKRAAEAHGSIIHSGKCEDATDCHKWRGMKICKSGAAEAWDGSNTIHGAKDGHCMQFRGAVIKNGKVDAAIATKLESNGINLKEGGCRAAGFDDELKQWHVGTVSVSVWIH